ncbi:hypothetical protein Tco_0401902, partial [Tanacetum coccineum]
ILDDKKFQVDVEVFREILGICPRVPNEDFVTPPSEEDLLAFLIELGNKGPLDHLARMFVDHMHQPCRTLAIIINKSLSGKTSNNDRLRQSRVSILWGYGRAIPDTMLTEDIKQTEAYQTFIKYSTDLIPPKKAEVKGHKARSQLQTGSKRKSKKKVSISVDDNIIPEPDVTLKLGKSMSLTKAEEEEAARQVHATHERLVIESDPEPARRSTRRRPSGIAFRDTSNVSKKKSPDQSLKLKGIHTLNAEEQLATDTMQALKASKKSSRSQPHVGVLIPLQ